MSDFGAAPARSQCRRELCHVRHEPEQDLGKSLGFSSARCLRCALFMKSSSLLALAFTTALLGCHEEPSVRNPGPEPKPNPELEKWNQERPVTYVVLSCSE